jgi:hypothetical protein
VISLNRKSRGRIIALGVVDVLFKVPSPLWPDNPSLKKSEDAKWHKVGPVAAM